MNVLQPWNVVFLAGFLVFVWIRHVYSGRAKGQTKTVRRIDGIEIALLLAVGAGTLVLPLLYLFTQLLSFADHAAGLPVRWSGAAIMLAALWLFWRSHVDLGANWSVSLELREGHQLVTHGVYRCIRHPMYASIWLWALAQALLLGNWLAGCAALPTFGAMYILRTPREERLMRESFGAEYHAYMARTGRLLPRLR